MENDMKSIYGKKDGEIS